MRIGELHLDLLPLSDVSAAAVLILLVAMSVLLCCSGCSAADSASLASGPAAAEAPSVDEVARLIARSGRAHPRLLLSDGAVQRVRDNIAADEEMKAVYDRILVEADGMHQLKPVERVKQGGRLLDVSRTCLWRVMTLAFAHRMTGERKYLDRAEQEMLAAASFDDWNPSHFLDVAEMTAALAIGYDWLYDELSEASRKSIRAAIVQKGLRRLRTSFGRAHWWVSSSNNWNPVCHGGLTLGALAVMEDEPALAAEIVSRAVANVPNALRVYGPNGAYPEGPTYWEYGTTYTVLLIEALRTSLGTSFGLADHAPLLASANYYLHAQGPTGRYFNYSDCGTGGGLAPAAFWFARRLERPELLWFEKQKLRYLLKAPALPERRFLPLLLVWTPGLEDIVPPKKLHYHDRGVTPVGMHRTGWDGNATFVGLKGGSPKESHSHMDIGSFVMTAEGVRWAVGLGAQEYSSLESAGIGLWDYSQTGGRWTVYRLNSRSHNTLVVNDQLQRAEGKGEIIKFSDIGARPHTVIDMSDVYRGQLAEARRGVALVKGRGVVVQDELQAGPELADVRWAMVTRADVVVDGSHAILRKHGRALRVSVLQPEGAKFEVLSTEGPAEYDAPNPGTRMLAFRTRIPAGQKCRLVVWLRPADESEAATQAPDETAGRIEARGRDASGAMVSTAATRPVIVG